MPIPRVLAIVRPSGSGKSTVARTLHAAGLIDVVPTWTTRPRRPDEQRGSIEHRFVSDSAFDDLDRHGFFRQTATLPALPYRYGVPRIPDAQRGIVTAVLLRASSLDRLACIARPVVYQIADDVERTRSRLIRRGLPAQELDARLSDHEAEVAMSSRIADRTFLNARSVDALLAEITAALRLDARVAA